MKTETCTFVYPCKPDRKCTFRWPGLGWLAVVVSGLVLISEKAIAQDSLKHAVTLKILGVSYHLRKSQTPELFPNRLDEEGIWVANFGAIAGYEYFLKPHFSVRMQQGAYSDCSGSFGGFSHIGFRARLLQKGRHELIGGIGPTLVYRQDWNRLDGYRDDGFFARTGNWQYRFFWYAGELEYYYRFTETRQAGITLIPGLPELVLFGLSYRVLY